MLSSSSWSHMQTSRYCGCFFRASINSPPAMASLFLPLARRAAPIFTTLRSRTRRRVPGSERDVVHVCAASTRRSSATRRPCLVRGSRILCAVRGSTLATTAEVDASSVDLHAIVGHAVFFVLRCVQAALDAEPVALVQDLGKTLSTSSKDSDPMPLGLLLPDVALV